MLSIICWIADGEAIGLAVGVGIGRGDAATVVGTDVEVVVAALKGVVVSASEGETAGNGSVAVEAASKVGVAAAKETIRGATQSARSPLEDPRFDTLKTNLTFSPASWLKSRSRLKYLPS